MATLVAREEGRSSDDQEEIGVEEPSLQAAEEQDAPLEIEGNAAENAEKGSSWHDTDDTVDSEKAPTVSELIEAETQTQVQENVLENTESSADAVLSSCKANLAGLRDLLLRLRAIPDAQHVLPVQSGIDYLLASTFTAKVLQLAEYFPSGITEEERDAILEILNTSVLYYETCKSVIFEAEEAKSWTTALSRKLDTNWKSYGLQLLAIPELLHLPALNLSLLVGNTILDQEGEENELENGSYSSISTHMRRARRRRQRRIDPTMPQRVQEQPHISDTAQPDLAPDIYDAENPLDGDRAPESVQERASVTAPPPYPLNEILAAFDQKIEKSPPGSVLSRRSRRGKPAKDPNVDFGPAMTAQGLYKSGFQPVSMFTGHIYGPIYISHNANYPTSAPNQTLPHSPPPEHLPSPPPAPPERIRPRFARALFDFDGRDPEDLKFKSGDVIEIVEKMYEGWWYGKCQGREGMVPANYITFETGFPRPPVVDTQGPAVQELPEQNDPVEMPKTWLQEVWDVTVVVGWVVLAWLFCAFCIAGGIAIVRIISAISQTSGQRSIAS